MTSSGEKHFIKASSSMRRIAEQASQLAKVDVAVLIIGESGAGKEVVARFLHDQSPRASQTFLKVNCAALPADLLESELFGYEAGAFTGAVRAKPGKFELCDKGTIFLDEVAEMPVSLQAKLLHVLQDGEFMRLGGRAGIHVDVRVIAATNVNVNHAIATNTFREDLYYRLGGFVLNVPPLRERPEDIPLLLQHCIQKFAKHYGLAPVTVTPDILESCLRYSWPGNVRELENVAKRLLILGAEDLRIEVHSTAPSVQSAPPDVPAPRRADGDLKTIIRNLKKDAEVEAIELVLDQTHWNRKETARQLNISYKALLNKIREYGLDQPRPVLVRKRTEASPF